MFGYVRAVTPVLAPEEARRYEAVYCGLCRTLGERYGKTAQLILNYDFVFLAILLARPETGGTFPDCPCPVHPWRKKTCWLGSPALDAAADATVILTWWKLQDALRDGKLAQRMGSRAAALPLRGHYRAAAARWPAFDETVRSCLEELHQLERDRVPSLDRPADTFARILQAAAVETDLAARTRGVQQILYHVGRWIYLADAWDDLAEDQRTGNYNPLLARFGDQAAASKESLRETMRVSLGLANTAFPCWTGESGSLCWAIFWARDCPLWKRPFLPASGSSESAHFIIIKGPRLPRCPPIRRRKRMNDPYAVLGVSSSASEEEIKRAYRDLVKKYHPDNYANNPLADLAEAKMKEVNEAYDAIMKARTQGGYQSAGGNGYGGGRTSSQGGGRYNNPTLIQVRQLIAQNNLAEAERILRSTPANNGEWYYLMGSIAYRRGWMDDARQNFWTACNMDPNNMEYRQAMNSMGMQARRGTYGGGDDIANLCTTLCCLNCLCNSCSG